MRISDWSSDVCSSDLEDEDLDQLLAGKGTVLGGADVLDEGHRAQRHQQDGTDQACALLLHRSLPRFCEAAPEESSACGPEPEADSERFRRGVPGGTGSTCYR